MKSANKSGAGAVTLSAKSVRQVRGGVSVKSNLKAGTRTKVLLARNFKYGG